MKKGLIKDIILWIIAALTCFIWRIAAAKDMVMPYIGLFATIAITWILLGLIFRKYRDFREIWYWQEMLSLLCVTASLWAICHFCLPLLAWNVSTYVAEWGVFIVAIEDAVAILIAHYWKYALNISVPVMEVETRKNATIRRPDEKRSETSMNTIHDAILSITTEEDYQLLLEKAHLDSRRTKVVANRDRFSFMQIPDYEYDTLVDMTLLNDAKGINKRFCIVNQKLPDNGHYVCCYRPQEYVKQKILNRYPMGINWIIYIFWFVWKRIIPRILLTSRLYYDLTKGRKRMLSKTEVLGRLYYCGFEVEEMVTMQHIVYVFATRHSQPYEQEKMKVYGPLIKLPRICKTRKSGISISSARCIHTRNTYKNMYLINAEA